MPDTSAAEQNYPHRPRPETPVKRVEPSITKSPGVKIGGSWDDYNFLIVDSETGGKQMINKKYLLHVDYEGEEGVEVVAVFYAEDGTRMNLMWVHDRESFSITRW